MNMEQTGVYCVDVLQGAPVGHKSYGLLVGYGANTDNLWLYCPEKETVKARYAGHDTAVYSVTLNSNSCLSGDKSGFFVLHDLSSETPINKWQGHENVVHSVAFCPEDEKKLTTCSRDGHVHVFDTRTDGQAVATIEDAAAGYTVFKALWCNGIEVVASGDDFCIKRWDTRFSKKAPVASYMGHTSGVRALVISPDRNFFLSGAVDGSVRIWLADVAASRRNALEPQIREVEVKIEAAEWKVGEISELVRSGEAGPQEARDAATDLKALQEELQKLIIPTGKGGNQRRAG